MPRRFLLPSFQQQQQQRQHDGNWKKSSKEEYSRTKKKAMKRKTSLSLRIVFVFLLLLILWFYLSIVRFLFVKAPTTTSLSLQPPPQDKPYIEATTTAAAVAVPLPPPTTTTTIPTFNNNNNKKNKKRTVGIVYVHIGKTGGEWLKAQLAIICQTRRNPNIRRACMAQTYPSKLSQLTVGYIHASNNYFLSSFSSSSSSNNQEQKQQQKKRNTLDKVKRMQTVQDDFSTYLLSIRHPLRRLISWYTYNHPKSCDDREPNSPACKNNQDWKRNFFDCFPTLQQFSDAFVFPNEKSIVNNETCWNVLWNGWYAKNGVEAKESNHLYWNYQFYWNQTLAQTPNQEVYILRQESLEKDLDVLETFLRRSPTTTTISSAAPAKRLVQWHPPDSFHFVRGGAPSKLNRHGIHHLCCILLSKELEIYETLLQRAINPLFQKEQTLDQIYEQCQLLKPTSTTTSTTTIANDLKLACQEVQQYYHQ